MNRNSLIRLSVTVIVLFVLVSVTNGFAEGIKARMQARLPAIVALKGEGVIGEDNKGYLAFVGSARKQVDIVAGENQDRRQVYAAIAKQQGSTVEVVGELRARQIAENASPGEWLQNEQGAWIQK
jgi:uncharacterized protein YdbL (DUF1318 family)